MSDTRARELERGWRQTRDLAAAAEWLEHRARLGQADAEAVRLAAALRAGRVGLRALELAAYLGAPLALELFGPDAVTRIAYLGDFGAVRAALGEELDLTALQSWLAGLARQDPTLLPRALAGMAADALRRDVPELPEGPDPDDPWDVRAWGEDLAALVVPLLERALAWAGCPCAEHAEAAFQAELGLLEAWIPNLLRAQASLGLARLALDLIGRSGEDQAEHLAGLETLPGLPSPTTLAGAVRASLLPWLLEGRELDLPAPG